MSSQPAPSNEPEWAKPRRRRWISWAGKFGALVLGYATYLFGDWAVGMWQWQRYKSEAQARGVMFDFPNGPSDPVPDSENIERLPFLDESPGEARFPLPDHLGEWPDMPLPVLHDKVRTRKWIAASTGSMSEDILAGLERFEPELAQLRQMLNNPAARFSEAPPDLEPESEGERRGLLILDATTVLLWRTKALAASGRAREALDELGHVVRMTDLLRKHPRFWMNRNGVYIQNVAGEIVQDAMNLRTWRESELQALSSPRFQEEKPLTSIHRELLNIRLWEDWDVFSRGKTNLYWYVRSSERDSPLRTALSYATPRGRMLRERIRFHSLMELAASSDDPEKGVPGSGYDQVEAETGGVDPGMHSFSPAIQRACWTRDRVTKSLRACARWRAIALQAALLRYEKRHGALPERATNLIPDFLDALPLDPMDGQPLRYGRDNDGGCRVWSVGWDRVDNQGPVEYPGGWPKVPDWTWRLAPPPKATDTK